MKCLVSGLPRKKARRWLPILLGISGVNAQTCLVLSPATIDANGTASMDLSLYSASGESPAAVQWTFRYPTSSIGSLAVEDGPMLTSAGKTAVCAGNAAAYNCLAVGTNATTIPNGVIAKVTAVLAPGASTASIQIGNPLGASAAGDPIPISSRIMRIAGAYVTYDCRLHPPSRGAPGGR